MVFEFPAPQSPNSRLQYLSWVVPENNGGIILGYKLYRNNGNGTAMSGSSDATCGMETSPAPQNCIVTGLTPGEEYQIQMATVNEVGEGMRSDPMIFIAAKVKKQELFFEA